MRSTNPGDCPGLDCLTDGHIFVDWIARGIFTVRQKGDPIPTDNIPCDWCLWCGTAAYDADRVTEETPT